MDVVKEVFDDLKKENYILVKTPVREKLIKVEWPPYMNQAKWQIKYEDNTPINAPELEGNWLTLRDAKRAIGVWEQTAKLTPGARYQDRPKAPPVKRKRVAKDGSTAS